MVHISDENGDSTVLRLSRDDVLALLNGSDG